MKDQESTTKESKWKALCLSHVGTKKKEESDAQPKAYKKKPSNGSGAATKRLADVAENYVCMQRWENDLHKIRKMDLTDKDAIILIVPIASIKPIGISSISIVPNSQQMSPFLLVNSSTKQSGNAPW